MRWQRHPQGNSHRELHDPRPEGVMTEAEYLQSLARDLKPVVVHLRSGEILRGAIEYYDHRFIRLTRQREPNLFIFKHDIKYFYEE
ncbi:MAG TPA: RNA chaperone Hfq [Terriglobia bacterium]